MGGPRLTPEQLDRAAEVFAKTGNTSEAARVVGVAESTIRSALTRQRIARNRELHTRACEAGMRRARKYLATGLVTIDKTIRDNAFLEEGNTAPVTLEPEQLARLVGAMAQGAQSLVKLRESDDVRAIARLQRAKVRAEIARIEAETRALDKDARPAVEALADMIDALSPEMRAALSVELRTRAARSPDARELTATATTPAPAPAAPVGG